MDEISLATQELATPQKRGISSLPGELWEELRLEAARVAAREEILRGFLDVAVLRPTDFALGLGSLLARKLGELSMPVERLRDLALAAMVDEPAIIAAAAADLVAIRTRDPAAESYLTPFLYCSVVLHDVPPGATVAGVPARIVGWSSGSVPALEMDQSLPDYEF